MIVCKICHRSENVAYDYNWKEPVCSSCKEKLSKFPTRCSGVEYPFYYVTPQLKEKLLTDIDLNKEFLQVRRRFLNRDYDENRIHTDKRYTYVKYFSQLLNAYYLFVFDTNDLFVLINTEFEEIFHYQNPLDIVVF